MDKAFTVILATGIAVAVSAACGGWSHADEVPEAAPRSDTVTLVFAGDMMLHNAQIQQAHKDFLAAHPGVHVRSGSAAADTAFDFTPFLDEVKGRLEAADFAVVNMEFPLAGAPYTGYPAFSAPACYADYAAACGTDVFLAANNHVLDKGSEGFRRTLAHYDTLAAVRYTGCGKDSADFAARNPLILEKDSLRIALINFTYGTNLSGSKPWPAVFPMKRERIKEAIDRAKAANADFIIALPHWGEEYVLRHSAAQESLAKWMAAEGVDAIIGSHPHVVQDSSRLNVLRDSTLRTVPVVYSLGNFVSNMSIYHTQIELLATLRVIREGGGAVRAELSLEFLWCSRPGGVCGSYRTIPVKENLDSVSRWKNPAEHAKMVYTYNHVKKSTGIED